MTDKLDPRDYLPDWADISKLVKYDVDAADWVDLIFKKLYPDHKIYCHVCGTETNFRQAARHRGKYVNPIYVCTSTHTKKVGEKYFYKVQILKGTIFYLSHIKINEQFKLLLLMHNRILRHRPITFKEFKQITGYKEYNYCLKKYQEYTTVVRRTIPQQVPVTKV